MSGPATHIVDDDPAVREWLGRFLGRIHAVGATRQRILQAAYDLWLERPYDQVTVESVEPGSAAADGADDPAITRATQRASCRPVTGMVKNAANPTAVARWKSACGGRS